MADKKLEYKVEVDSSGAERDLQKLGKAGEKAGQQIADGFKDVGSKSDAAFDKVVDGLKKITTESASTIKAVARIGESFGEGFDAADTTKLVTSLRKAGVEFETIEARADELATTMRQMDGLRLDAATESARRLGTEMDGVRNHSDQSRSVLANLAGNSAQDLGELGGVVGSLGVGIGQLAEYAVDGNIALSSLAGVAGPMAALTAGAYLVAEGVKAIGAETKEATAQTEEYRDALAEAGDEAQNVRDMVVEAGKLEFADNNADTFLRDLAELLPLVGEETVNLVDIFSRAGLNVDDYADSITGVGDAWNETITKLSLARTAGKITADEFRAVVDEMQDQRDRLEKAGGDTAGFFAESIESLNKQFQQIKAEEDPFSVMADKWAILVDDLRDGTIDTQEATDAVIALAEALGKTPTEIETIAWEGLNDTWDEATEKANDAREATEELNAAILKALPEIAQAIADINVDDLDNLATGFKNALDAAGDLGDFKFSVDFDEAFAGADGFVEKFAGEFKPDILELAAFMRNNLNLGNSITWGEVKTDDPEFAALVVDMTTMIKEGASRAYAAGGEEAAHQFVQSQAEALAKAVPGLTVADVYRLVGLPADGSLDAIIQPIIDAEATADALATLDALAGVDPDNPIIAFIKLGVQTGTIDPVIAEIAALILAGQYGVDVKPQLAAFTPEQIAAAEAQIAAAGGVIIPGQVELSDNWFDNLWTTPPEPVVIPTTLTADNAGAIDKVITAVADKRREAKIKVSADNAGAIDKILDGVASQLRTADIAANPTNIGPTDTALDTVAAPRTASITAEAHPAGANSALNGVAAHRTAHITAVAHTADADRDLDLVAAQPRYADIFVRTHNTVTTSNAGPIPGGPGTLAATPSTLAAGDEDAVGINPLAGPARAVTFGTPVSVSTSVAPVVHNHVTVQAAVIGSRYDVQRAVQKALRQAQRLNGARV